MALSASTSATTAPSVTHAVPGWGGDAVQNSTVACNVTSATAAPVAAAAAVSAAVSAAGRMAAPAPKKTFSDGAGFGQLTWDNPLVLHCAVLDSSKPADVWVKVLAAVLQKKWERGHERVHWFVDMTACEGNDDAFLDAAMDMLRLLPTHLNLIRSMCRHITLVAPTSAVTAINWFVDKVGAGAAGTRVPHTIVDAADRGAVSAAWDAAAQVQTFP